ANVVDMCSMFEGCENIIELNLSNFNTKNVTTMQSMFINCYKLTELNLSNFDTSSVITMLNMFGYCESLTELDVSSFDTSNVKDMRSIFAGCSQIKKIDLSSFDFNGEYYMDMFNSCSNLEELNLSSLVFIDPEYLSYLFYNVDSLRTLILPGSFNFGSVDFSLGLRSLPEKENNGETVYFWVKDYYDSEYVSSEDFAEAQNQLNDSSIYTYTIQKKHTVSFDIDGGTGENPANQNVYENQLVDNPTYNGTKKGYRFNGWKLGDDLYDFDNPVNKPIHLVADWQPKGDQSKIEVQDSSLYVGDLWTPQDNFVSAVDYTGESVAYDQISSKGFVDTTQPGTYIVQYTLKSLNTEVGAYVATATIIVKEKEAKVVSGLIEYLNEDGELISNPKNCSSTIGSLFRWESPIEIEGYTNDLDKTTFSITQMNAEVQVMTYKDILKQTNTSTWSEALEVLNSKVIAGPIISVVLTYQYQKNILEDLTTIVAKDSTLYVGDKWNPKDNFVSATDQTGNEISFDEGMVSEIVVDTAKAGEYYVTYTNMSQKCEIKVTVKDKGDLSGNPNKSISLETQIPSKKSNENENGETVKSQTSLPKTGDTEFSGFWGGAFLLCVWLLCYRKKRKIK
ncbi:bacterial Ig-like domain-containing protein, partial [Listeria monocytogenes]